MSQIKQIRRSIQDRRKKRDTPTLNKKIKTNAIYPTFTEEEKHGFQGAPLLDTPHVKKLQETDIKSRLTSNFIKKGVISTVLFLGLVGVLNNNQTYLEKPRAWSENMLQENFQFAKANKWYQQKFGSPFALFQNKQEAVTVAATESLPVSGDLTQTFQANGEGIMIAPEDSSLVHSMEEGIVIFAGNSKQTGKTIVIQHADGSKSTYGHLSDVGVHLYEHVQQNSKIAHFKKTQDNEAVFFSVEKNREFVDPIQVMKVDKGI